MQTPTKTYAPTLAAIKTAAKTLKGIASVTPLSYNDYYSKQWNCNLYLKREDLQQVRSYKIRGAYNKIASLTARQIENEIVCASAGNHAQGVALSCKLLQIKGTIFMPTPTPKPITVGSISKFILVIFSLSTSVTTIASGKEACKAL